MFSRKKKKVLPKEAPPLSVSVVPPPLTRV